MMQDFDGADAPRMIGETAGASRRDILKWTAGAGLAVAAPLVGASPAFAQRAIAAMPGRYPEGVIVISLRQRQLYLTMGDGRALRYPVAVGRAGKAWAGWARVEGKYVNPAWAPPQVVKRDNPRLPNLIPGGAPNNPMDPRALTLDREEIAIHGTTRTMRASVGSAASYGCIRMYNEDILDLFDRVSVGTPVVAV